MRFISLFCASVFLCFNINAQCLSGDCENGIGSRYFVDKDTVLYEGHFKNRYPEGYGVATYRFGKRYAGMWRQGLWHGTGALTLADAQTISGTWEYSKLKNLSDDSNPIAVTEPSQPGITFGNLTPDASFGETPKQKLIPSKLNSIVTAPQSTPQIWALAVGVAEYENTTVPPIKYPDNDAFGMFAFWKSPNGGALDEKHVRVITDDAATKKAVVQNIESLFYKAQHDDLAILFFSGHGLIGSFLTTDYDGAMLQLYHKEINTLMSKCPARHKLIIADACYAGSYIASKGLNASTNKVANTEKFYSDLNNSNSGTAYMLSCAPDEESLEVNTLQNSVFTYFVLKGLNGEANTNNDGEITLKELFDYVKYKVIAYAKTIGKVQTPMLKGNYDLNMPVAIIK